VIHVHGWGYALARAVTRAARKMGKPYLIAPHGALGTRPGERRSPAARFLAWWHDKPLVQAAASVTALNEVEEHDLRQARAHEAVVQLPVGIDMKRYATPAPIASEETATPARSEPELPAGRLILMLGPIHPAEGLVPLLTALAELGPEVDGWNVVMAGPAVADWREQLEAAVRRKGGEGRIVFAPAPDEAAQRRWLARASILASPALHPRCPTSILQAVSTGVPVLASSLVIPSTLDNAVHVCAPTRGDIKLGLRRLLALSDAQRRQIGHDAREVARVSLDWRVLAQEYARLYQDVT
jgi:poly(glycerol-phosphate) alpha-glucosyltransferase